MELLKISDLASKVSLPISTIRHYTNLGLLEVSSYTEGGQYLYDGGRAFKRLNYIQRLIDLNYTLKEIKYILDKNRHEKRVLIIDDDSAFSSFLGDIIKENWRDWDVRIANNVFIVGRLLESFIPDLVLLDLNLPGVDGFYICREIKKDPAFTETKIIAITAYSNSENRHRILDCGADLFMSKPISKKMLFDEITKLLNL